MDLVTNQQKESGYLCHPGCKKSGQCIRSECVWCSSWCGCGPGSCLSRAGDPCRPPQCPPSTHHFPLTNPFARSDCSVPLLPRLSPTLPLNLPISSSHQNHHQNLSSPPKPKKGVQTRITTTTQHTRPQRLFPSNSVHFGNQIHNAVHLTFRPRLARFHCYCFKIAARLPHKTLATPTTTTATTTSRLTIRPLHDDDAFLA